LTEIHKIGEINIVRNIDIEEIIIGLTVGAAPALVLYVSLTVIDIGLAPDRKQTIADCKKPCGMLISGNDYRLGIGAGIFSAPLLAMEFSTVRMLSNGAL
jgi:hypothetical protein